jgi:hypothetical protein
MTLAMPASKPKRRRYLLAIVTKLLKVGVPAARIQRSKLVLILRADGAHMFVNNFRRAEPEKELQTAKYHGNVIQLSQSRKKIRHQVDRQNYVSKYASEQQLCTGRNSRIFDQAMKQLEKTWQIRQ